MSLLFRLHPSEMPMFDERTAVIVGYWHKYCDDRVMLREKEVM